MFFILDSSFKRFKNCTVKPSAKETKWTSLEVRTHPTFLETLILKYDFGPVNLPGLSRNGPQELSAKNAFFGNFGAKRILSTPGARFLKDPVT